MTILRHLNLAGFRVKPTPRLNLTLPRERSSNYSVGLNSQIDAATQSDPVQEPSKLALNGLETPAANRGREGVRSTLQYDR